MELNQDLLSIQGILISAMKATGEFTRINNRGGNEQKILNIMMEIKKFISIKNYMVDDKINEKYDRQLEDIVFFLALNTTYNDPLDLEEYDHLINIMPQLSKCLLVNIVYGLDLCKYYCRVIEILPTPYSIELLEETIPCLKKSIPKVQLCYAFLFLKTVVNKLTSVIDCKKEEDNIDNMTTVSNIILQNLTGLQSDQVKNLKAAQIYEHMGYCLLNLFQLLLYCDKDHLNLKKFIDNILRTCCSLVKNITINVFCSWAEIEEDGIPLQNIISENAYLVVDKYQKYAPARELISMLATMAKKPKTLSERIQESDTSTIIKFINEGGPNQRSWFQALLNTQVFENSDAVKCINKWANLCNEDDVLRLLNMSFQLNKKEANALTIKCASFLNLEKLILVTTRYYYKNKFKYILNEDVQPQLTVLFNKAIDNTQTNEEFIREICLLLLQNPQAVFGYIYNECLKNSFYTKCLRNTFSSIQEISKIDSIGINIFRDVILKTKPNSENVSNIIDLFKVLLETKYFTTNNVIALLHNLLQMSYEENSLEGMKYALEIFLGISINLPVKEENKNTIELLLNIMNGCRCIVMSFNMQKQQIVKDVVDMIMGCCEMNANYNFKVEPRNEFDEFTNYYTKYVSNEQDLSLLRYFCPDFDIANYAKCVSQLLRILPRSVTYEWLSISQEIHKECGIEKTMELLADVMILLCQTIQTQSSKEEIFLALRYCIQQYGVVAQTIQDDSTLEVEIIVTKQLCRVLRYIPDNLKEEEGLCLINILTERSLKSLANDKEFVCFLISINNKMLCKVLAQKITS